MNAADRLVILGECLMTSDLFKEKAGIAQRGNPWFVPLFVTQATEAIYKDMLTPEALEKWLSAYRLKLINKTIGLIFAGNVPLVGFHDFLCCYVAGCKMKIKLSSKDDVLFPAMLEILNEHDPAAKERITLVEKLTDFDAVIATGSDNTNRYFEYYFRHYPAILRRNRNAVAILNGDETPEQLDKLADDIFLYFGFGCRNVSKIYVPIGYNLTQLFPSFNRYTWLHNHNRYMNNYDYNRTVLLMNKTPHLANEFVMILENAQIPSPIATLHYEYWHDEQVLNTTLKQNADKIQCIVSGSPEKWEGAPSVAFGGAQHPGLADYADGVDTLDFLLKL